MKKYVLVVAVAAALFSCSGNPKADATQTDKNKQETAQVPDMHNAETSLDYWGVYEGTLPAASSPGIKTTLTLNKDKTFTLRSEYIDEKDGIFNDKGTYTLDGNILTAKQEGGDITYYKVEEGQLKMLDQQKQPVTGDLAKFYILKQTKEILGFIPISIYFQGQKHTLLYMKVYTHLPKPKTIPTFASLYNYIITPMRIAA